METLRRPQPKNHEQGPFDYEKLSKLASEIKQFTESESSNPAYTGIWQFDYTDKKDEHAR